MLFGGVEGGATHSVFILFDTDANLLATVEGPGSNLFQLGLEETCRRIQAMVKEGLELAHRDANSTLEGLGLSLSGCESEDVNSELAAKFKELFPGLSRHYAVCSDTIGTLLSASPNGGVVIISGTGSNSLLVNPDGQTFRCGGWGHLLGDEGGAFWIAQRAMKIYFDDLDNMGPRPKYPTDGIGRVILNYFDVKDRFGLLTYCYDKFVKSHFAGVCKDIAQLATSGDKLAAEIFEDAGRALAAHVVALSPNISDELLKQAGGLLIVCIGSVWKSWELMKVGFLKELSENAPRVKEVSLVHLKVPMATGACYLGVDAAKAKFKKVYADNTETFFHGRLEH